MFQFAGAHGVCRRLHLYNLARKLPLPRNTVRLLYQDARMQAKITQLCPTLVWTSVLLSE
jgi:hypothetical protein